MCHFFQLKLTKPQNTLLTLATRPWTLKNMIPYNRKETVLDKIARYTYFLLLFLMFYFYCCTKITNNLKFITQIFSAFIIKLNLCFHFCFCTFKFDCCNKNIQNSIVKYCYFCKSYICASFIHKFFI